MIARLTGTIPVAMLLTCLWSAHVGAAPPDRAPAFSRALYYYCGLQGRVLWIDATANLDRTTTREGVADIVARARDAGFTTLVVDVKPVSGHVLFPSKIAPRLTEWRGKPVPDADVLQMFIDEGHRAGLEVGASVNVFSEGHKHFRIGPAYEKPDWQSVVLATRRELRAPDGSALRIRAPDDPAETGVPVALGPDSMVRSAEAQDALALVVQHDGTVDGMLDSRLIGDEPLAAPDAGRLLVLRDAAREWAVAHLRAGEKAVFYAESRLLPVTEAPSEPVAAFVNPLHPQARDYELALIREIVERYAVDSVVLDRMRYSSIWADFSPLTRAAFERWLGRRVDRWPQDILDASKVPGDPVLRGPLFSQWLHFRAAVISDFARQARRAVRSIRPNVQIAAYVGSWFTAYYGVGVNWASERYPVRAYWATPAYNDSGYAEQLDWLTTGCYYSIATRDQARAQGVNEGATVETAAVVSMRVTANMVPVYAGLYLLNYEGRPQDFAIALETALRRSAGVMLFDCSYLYDYNWWPLLRTAFQRTVRAPHAVPGLLSQIRSVQDAVVSAADVDSVAAVLPPVVALPGGG